MITEERAKTHKKDYELLSLHMFSASFFTRSPRSVFFILVLESLKPVACSKTIQTVAICQGSK